MIRRFVLLFALLFAAPHQGGPPTPCYVACIAQACKDACSDERAAKDCRPCLEKYDEVCLAQCKPRPTPPPSETCKRPRE